MTPWAASGQASLSFTISCSLLKLMSVELMIPSNHLILCHPLLLLPSIFPNIRVFSNEYTLHQVVKVVEDLEGRRSIIFWGMSLKRGLTQDFPGSPVVKTSPSNAGVVGFIPGRGAKIPHASWPKNQNIKQKQYCNKFKKDFENIPQQKKKKIFLKVSLFPTLKTESSAV